jgi:hypothetical protein
VCLTYNGCDDRSSGPHTRCPRYNERMPVVRPSEFEQVVMVFELHMYDLVLGP